MRAASVAAKIPCMRELARRLVTLEGKVGRKEYALAGFSLMALKYAFEAVAIRLVTGASWTPLEYFTPLWSVRESKLGAAPDGFLLLLGAWTLPFVWIGASMTLRRARDAGFSASTVLLFFFPVVNYVWMLFLVAAPRREREELEWDERDERFAPALAAVGITGALGLAVAAFSIYVTESYGSALFLGLPFCMGFSAGFLLNRRGEHGLGATLGVASLALLFASLLLLLFAVEGAMCIAMVATLALPVALAGALFGRVAARSSSRGSAVFPALALVPLAWLEARVEAPAVFEVATSIEVDAPPEQVWPNVIGFAELPPPEHWIFRTGIAYPLRARIEGEGVGAVRRCEFSTGAFVEPITAWEPPARLAFDVLECPLPMRETSFYARVEPPHLGRSFRSVRGEFRLIALPGGRTRLEGRTWYRLELRPVAYWRSVSDFIVHRIHRRVLEHVKRLSERA